MIKKLGDFTLREVQEICEKSDCDNCCFGEEFPIGKEVYYACKLGWRECVEMDLTDEIEVQDD